MEKEDKMQHPPTDQAAAPMRSLRDVRDLEEVLPPRLTAPLCGIGTPALAGPAAA